MFDDLKDDKNQKMNSIEDVEKKICNVEDKVTNTNEKIDVMFWMRDVPEGSDVYTFSPVADAVWRSYEKVQPHWRKYITRDNLWDFIAFLYFQIALCVFCLYLKTCTQLPASFACCNAIPANTDLPSEIITQSKLFFPFGWKLLFP